MKRYLTKRGTFEVRRLDDSPFIYITHVRTGYRCGGFSHIAVRTFRAALAGLDAVEAELSAEELALLDLADDPLRRHHAVDAVNRLRDALLDAFPNGAWAR